MMPENTFTPNQDQVPVQFQSEALSSSNIGKYALFVVLGFVLLGGSAYVGYWYATQQVQPAKRPTPVVSQPTPTDTSAVAQGKIGKWEKYVNEEHAYTVSYPSGWVLLEEDEGLYVDRKTDFHKKFSRDYPGEKGYTISITVEDNPGGLTSVEWVERIINYFPDPKDLKATLSMDYVDVGDNLKGLRVLGIPGQFQLLEVYISKGRKIYKLSVFPYEPLFFPELISESAEIFNQMLSTFKFLD